jgi:hypothetical protein
MNDFRYKLEVRISIVKEERVHPGDDYWRQTQERLSVEESLDLGAQDFLGVTRILANLHDSETALKEETSAGSSDAPRD